MRRFEFACGGAEAARTDPEATRISMEVARPKHNIHFRISDISRAMVSHVPDLLIDLLEIAAYVYCGDQRAPRGSDTFEEAGSNWRRDLHFAIPVRHPEIWQRRDIREALQTTLNFLSDDWYEFDFRPAKRQLPSSTDYFDLTDGGMAAEEVALFSGGIDSLAGAIDSIVEQGRTTVLVGHHSAPKVIAAQKHLIERLKKAGHASKLLYVPVKVTNAKLEPVETTQRTRSFLFACLAFVVARMFGHDRITFFENGVVSINLSAATDVVGARATRTTHPQAVSGFRQIFSALAEGSFDVQTPYLWSTKKEVVERIVSSGFGELLPLSISCAHPREWTKEVRHCGTCSQCIDRRFAVLAAGAETFEPTSGYEVDLLTGDRPEGDDLRMAVTYLKFCRQLHDMTRHGFSAAYSELYQAAGHVPGLSSSQAIDRLWDLHQRHAQAVLSVIEAGVQQHAPDLAAGRLPPRSLLSLYLSKARLEPVPVGDVTQQVADFMSGLEDQPCAFAVDDAQYRILFRGGFFLDGADYRVFRALLEGYRAAKGRREEVPFLPMEELASRVGVEESVLRRYVSKLRKRAIGRLTVDQGVVFERDGFIQNDRGNGYRIDPQLLEISLADLDFLDHR